MTIANLIFPAEPWMEDAACLSADPSLFFPKSGDDGRRAKLFCRNCPVRARCLDYALDFAGTGPNGSTKPNQADHGIYGGTTPWERDRIRRQRRGRAS